MDIVGGRAFEIKPTVNGDAVVVVTDSAGVFPDIDFTGITTDQGMKWDGSKLIATDFPAGGGSIVAEGESEGTSTSTTTTWAEKFDISYSFDVAKTYILFYQFEFRNTSTVGDTDVRIQRNNTANSVLDMRQEGIDGGSDQWHLAGGFRRFAGLSGTQTFDLDLAQNGDGTTSVRRARMLLLEF